MMPKNEYMYKEQELFILVMESCEKYLHRYVKEIYANAVTYIIQVLDPYGFGSIKSPLKQSISRKQYSKLNYSCSQADKLLKHILYTNNDLTNSIEYSKLILSSIDVHSDILNPWCKVTADIHELEILLNGFAIGENCSWDVGLIATNPYPVIHVTIWRIYDH